MFSLQQTCARAASFKLASTSSTKRRATMLKAVVEPKEENGSIDEEEKVSSVADAVQSAEKAFEMADATPAVETSSPKAMQAMM